MIGKDRSLKLGKNNDGLIMRDKGSKKTAVGIFPTMSGRNRQPAIQIVAGRGRGLLQPLRWRMARKVFIASTSASGGYRSARRAANPPRPASLYDCPNGQHSRRLSANYIATTRPSSTSHRASSSKTMQVSRASPPAASAMRFLRVRPSCNRLSC